MSRKLADGNEMKNVKKKPVQTWAQSYMLQLLSSHLSSGWSFASRTLRTRRQHRWHTNRLRSETVFHNLCLWASFENFISHHQLSPMTVLFRVGMEIKKYLLFAIKTFQFYYTTFEEDRECSSFSTTSRTYKKSIWQNWKLPLESFQLDAALYRIMNAECSEFQVSRNSITERNARALSIVDAGEFVWNNFVYCVSFHTYVRILKFSAEKSSWSIAWKTVESANKKRAKPKASKLFSILNFPTFTRQNSLSLRLIEEGFLWVWSLFLSLDDANSNEMRWKYSSVKILTGMWRW